jgi:hypothetical protein
LVRTSVGTDRVWTAWLGDEVTTDLAADLIVPSSDNPVDGVAPLKQLLREQRLIFSPI